jgi:hypothetical protein
LAFKKQFFPKKKLTILQETKRPSKEMQVSIARQLGLQPTTVGNFFMNARRRLHDKWQSNGTDNYNIQDCNDNSNDSKLENNNASETVMICNTMVDSYISEQHQQQQQQQQQQHLNNDHLAEDGFSLDSISQVMNHHDTENVPQLQIQQHQLTAVSANTCVYSLTSL